MRGGHIRRIVRQSGGISFSHKVDFCCLKQPANSTRDGYYVILHMSEYKQEIQTLQLFGDALKWGKSFADASDDVLRREFYRIQQQLATIIYKDVCTDHGDFYGGPQSREDVETRLEKQGDIRPFNTLGGTRPLPPRTRSQA